MVETAVKLTFMLVCLILQLLITGICLAIGFKIGNILYERGQQEYLARKQKPVTSTI